MSRDIDRRVAEALGWTDIQDNAYTPAGWMMCGTPPEGITPMWSSGRGIVPHYSTDIAAAWMLVEYLRDQWTAATDGVSGFDDSFTAPFDDAVFFEKLHRHADRRWPWAFLYVTPEAIAAAFLAALEQQQ